MMTGGDATPIASWAPERDVPGPKAARLHDCFLGGKDNFAADRDLGAALVRQVPSLPALARAQRAFTLRVAEWLAAERGVRQFVDIGCGLPAAGTVHEVVQGVSPNARVVYVDHDPFVIAHGRALLSSSAEGAIAFVHADLRDPQSLLQHPAFSVTVRAGEPVAVLLIGVLEHLQDADDPAGAVRAITAWMPPGSYLVIAGAAADSDPAAMAAAGTIAAGAGVPFVARHREEFVTFFAGTDLLDPGLVPVQDWPSGCPDAPVVPGWAGVARKPAAP